MVVGAWGADPSGSLSGSSYVIFGKASDFSTAIDLSSLNGSNGFRLDGEAAGDHSGDSVSNAGDVNGDGIDDLIVGSSRTDLNGNDPGSSYVVFGKASGFNAAMDLSGLDGSNGFRLDGVAANDVSGGAVSAAGDINGDGIDDLIVGSPRTDLNGNDSGSSYVVFGKASGFSAAMDLSSLNGSDGFRLDGVAANDTSGGAVSAAGDINGDGFDDVIIGAHRADSNGEYSGSSYVVFGKSSGFSAAMDLSSLDGSNGFRLDGEVPYSLSGFSVSNAGDVNGDGLDDLIIGAYGAPFRGYNSGASYVVFGRASGFSATMSLSSLDGSNGFRLSGEAQFDQFGRSVSTAGDVNGDGFDDLIIGAPIAPYGGQSGSSYVIFGRSSFEDADDADFQGTPGDDNFIGTKAAESFKGEAGNDRMIGRGGADWFDGGAGNDYIRILGTNFEFIDGGTGTDTLGLAGSGIDMDLSLVIDKTHGIETISLYGVGDNRVSLTAQDVIDLSDTTNTLKIKGNAGDGVFLLGGDWVDGGVHGNFHTYTQDEAVILVGVNVTTDFA